jgi:hypothetical protein
MSTSDLDVVKREVERFEAVRTTVEDLQRATQNIGDVITRGSVQSHLSHLEGQFSNRLAAVTIYM